MSSTWETHWIIPYGLSTPSVLRAGLVGVSRDQTLEEEGMARALVKAGIFIRAADLRYRPWCRRSIIRATLSRWASMSRGSVVKCVRSLETQLGTFNSSLA